MSLWHFSTDHKGNVAPAFGLAMVPLIGLIGMAIDYSTANSARTALQAAVDATALSLAEQAQHLSVNQMTQLGPNYVTADFHRSDAQITDKTTNYDPVSSIVTVTAGGNVPAAFMQLFNTKQIPISVQAKARAANDGLGCVLSLNPSASGATTVKGTADIRLNGCDLYDDSANASALAATGSGTISAHYVGVVGNISGKGAISATNGIGTGVSPIHDPYAAMNFPAFSGCTDHNLTVKNDTTISPGVYCGGIQVNAGATLTLNPGIYYVDRGTFTVNGGATVNGTGVTIVFTSSNGSNYATASFNGGANINLSAPSSGPTAGIVLFGDRNMPAGTAFSFNGGSTQVLGGAIYTPKAAVSFAGGANTTTGCTKLIGDTVTFTGNSNFAIDCSGVGTKAIGKIIASLLQ